MYLLKNIKNQDGHKDMSCINLKIRTRKYEKYIYCTERREQIGFIDCRNCKYKKYKPIKELKKKSKKQKRLEDKRYSIITDNLKDCYICKQKPKEDLHEAFGGSNRRKSIEWGLVIPICRKCHGEIDINQELKDKYQKEAQKIFEERYSHELFMAEFKRNYI